MVWLFSKGSIEDLGEGADRLVGLWYHDSSAVLLSLPMLASVVCLTNLEQWRRMRRVVGIRTRKVVTDLSRRLMLSV